MNDKQTRNLDARHLALAAIFAIFAAAYYYPEESFITLVLTFVVAIPIIVVAYTMFGLRAYIKDRKYVIIVSVKPEYMKYFKEKNI